MQKEQSSLGCSCLLYSLGAPFGPLGTLWFSLILPWSGINILARPALVLFDQLATFFALYFAAADGKHACSVPAYSLVGALLTIALYFPLKACRQRGTGAPYWFVWISGGQL